MTTTIDATLKITAWDESTIAEFDDGTKLTRADVTLDEGSSGLTSGSFHSVIYYRADGTSSYTQVLHLNATLHGRTGSFTLIGDGAYDGNSAVSWLRIVDNSGTGDLSGITGSAESDSAKAEHPFMALELSFEFD